MAEPRERIGSAIPSRRGQDGKGGAERGLVKMCTTMDYVTEHRCEVGEKQLTCVLTASTQNRESGSETLRERAKRYGA